MSEHDWNRQVYLHGPTGRLHGGSTDEDGPQARPHIDDPWADLGEPLGVGLLAWPVAHAEAWSGPPRWYSGDPVTCINQRRSDYR